MNRDNTVVNAVRAEVVKLVTVPSTYLAAGVSVLGTAGIALLNSRVSPDAGFTAVPFGAIGVIVLGVLIATGDTATGVLCVPRRGVLLGAKVLVLAVLSAVLAGAALLAAVPFDALAELGWRAVGAVVYWVCSALIAFAVGSLSRSTVVPLVLFVVNSALVSVTYLLTKVTPLARFLPDVAGAQMFVRGYPAEHVLSPVAGGVTMVAWTAGLVVVAGLVFARRDVGGA
ncbi:ABC transporter permease [Saccharothrix variisporea]|uniref:ABC transporter permease n=1 Tax=Saccharothrix variisporea TaxID=543527 RepID=UPI000EB18BD8|nr:ABC transporter permease [Saccharothrix variisporea]